MAEEEALRQEIIDCCLRMNREGINQGTSGNVSVRWQEGLLITPSGTPASLNISISTLAEYN